MLEIDFIFNLILKNCSQQVLYIGDDDGTHRNILNPVLLGNLKINNPQGLTLNKNIDNDDTVQFGFVNKTGDIFKFEVTGPTPNSGSCYYFHDGNITFNKKDFLPGDYSTKISLMQYPDVYAIQSFNIPEPPNEEVCPTTFDSSGSQKCFNCGSGMSIVFKDGLPYSCEPNGQDPDRYINQSSDNGFKTQANGSTGTNRAILNSNSCTN